MLFMYMCADNVSTLFRASTLSTMLMDQLMKLTAMDYLHRVLKEPVQAIADLKDAFEVVCVHVWKHTCTHILPFPKYCPSPHHSTLLSSPYPLLFTFSPLPLHPIPSPLTSYLTLPLCSPLPSWTHLNCHEVQI